MDPYIKLFTDTIVNDKDSFNNLLKVIPPKSSVKDITKSELTRKNGNKLFLKKYHTAEEHKCIFELYCESISFAFPKSEHLAFAYGNRSAFLLHIKKFKESIVDIEQALKITNSNPFKVKLLCRKIECLNALGSPCAGNEKILKEAKVFLENISDDDTAKKILIELLRKTENNIDQMNTILLEQFKNLEVDENKDIEETNIFKSVSIKYNEKYGRYLVANRDFQPGDIIYTEKYYASSLNLDNASTNCHHCLKFCWTLIPCDECFFALFCSEDCKHQAFEKYHKYECLWMIQLIHASVNPLESMLQCWLPIRLLILALNEAGGIKNLRNELEKIDNEAGTTNQNSVLNNRIDNKFTFIYKLHSFINLNPDYYKPQVKVSVLLINLLFKDKYNFQGVEDIIENENIVFIGGLLLKISRIYDINAFTITAFEEEIKSPNVTNNSKQDDSYGSLSLGNCILVVSSLLNHSCNCNTSISFGNKQNVIAYALQPIKKNSQLFVHYKPMFFVMSKAERQMRLKPYNFTCDCDACVNNWPVYNFKQPLSIYTTANYKLNMVMIELAQKIKYISETMKEQFDSLKKQDYIDIIRNLSRCIVQALHHLPAHSEIVCRLYFILRSAMDVVYSIKVIKFHECQKV